MNHSRRSETQHVPSPQEAVADITSTDQALAVFDRLDPVGTDFMLGDWKGAGVHTDHPLDGVLEAANWYGKRFESLDRVHPLIHRSLSGQTFSVQPALMPIGCLMRYPSLKELPFKRLFLLCRPLFGTRRPGARLRMTEYRGVSSATMVYDRQPINDVFRKIDDDTVLGAMDMRGMDRPFFFKLERLAGPGPWYGIADVEIYARQGKTRLALDTLRQAIDEGYRRSWWSQGEGSAHMVSLLGEPEFKTMMDEIRADMTAQLARVRAMDAAGELANVPVVSID